MEFKIPVGELQDILFKLSQVVKINEDNITGMVSVNVGDNVVFKATDNHVSVVVISQLSEIVKKGKILLRLRDIKGYVSKFIPLTEDYGTENFHFVIDEANNEGIIKTKTLFHDSKPSYRKLKFEIIRGMDEEPIKAFGEPHLIINSSILKRGISKVLHCINSGEVRKPITGLGITVKNNQITFVGTNGVKLAEHAIDLNTDIEEAAYIFRYDFSSVLRNVLDDNTQVFIRIDGRFVYVKSDNMYVNGALIIGEDYPNYGAMFNTNKTITFPRIDFTDSILAVVDVTDPEDNNRLTLNFTDDKLILKNDRVEATHEFDMTFDHDLDVDVNAEFLSSILADFVGENLEINFVEGANYIVLKSKEDANHIALLTIVKRR